MAIENSVSNEHLRSSIVLTFSIAAYRCENEHIKFGKKGLQLMETYSGYTAVKWK